MTPKGTLSVHQIRQERVPIEIDSDRRPHAASRSARIHYHRERNHQVIDNQLIVPLRDFRTMSDAIGRRTRLGGMLSYHERAAASSASELSNQTAEESRPMR